MYRTSSEYQFANANRSSKELALNIRRSSINDLIEKFEVPKSSQLQPLQYKKLRQQMSANGQTVFYDDAEDYVYNHIEEIIRNREPLQHQSRAARTLLPIWYFIRPALETLAIAPLPMFFSLTGTAIFALIVIFVMPRGFSQILLYPAFRLIFGTLYPAYASYKAVKTKNVKEYVSRHLFYNFF